MTMLRHSLQNECSVACPGGCGNVVVVRNYTAGNMSQGWTDPLLCDSCIRDLQRRLDRMADMYVPLLLFSLYPTEGRKEDA